jgi:hypothetical protein
MMILLINTVDNTVAEGPMETAPDPLPDGVRAVIAPATYPEGMVWSPPADGFVEVEVPTVPLVPVAQFMLLFTPQEWIAIKRARATDEMVDYYWELMMAATNGIQLDYPPVIAGIDYVRDLGLIDQARADAVLAGRPPA